MIAAMSTAENVALFSTLGVVLAAIFGSTIPAIISNRKAKATSETIGQINGHGTVTQMLGKLLDRQSRSDERMARIEERSLVNTEKLAVIEGRLGVLEAPKVTQQMTGMPLPPPAPSAEDPSG